MPHETIYRTLFVQARGELRAQLKSALRTGWTRRVDPAQRTRTRTVDTVMISERPKVTEDGAVPGFWESDLILGMNGTSQIGTLVERDTRFVLLVRIPYDRAPERVAYLLARKMETLPDFLRVKPKRAQIRELTAHENLAIAADMPIYFCDPLEPWRAGSNENTNSLLRQYFPKGTDLAGHTQVDLDAVALELNGRPRQTLDWDTPRERLDDLLRDPPTACGRAVTA
ncbi:hypothetical protein Acsp05_41130 [Actinokineospora sp. NBRC 105648]|nr:hypothetical protein Acsp05_41130 [Actinokineospora sp. NBRC 105648]